MPLSDKKKVGDKSKLESNSKPQRREIPTNFLILRTVKVESPEACEERLRKTRNKECYRQCQDWNNTKAPRHIQKNIRRLVTSYPDGILCSHILEAYKRRYSRTLKSGDYGYKTLFDLISSLSDTIHYKKAGKSDYLVFKAGTTVPDYIANDEEEEEEEEKVQNKNLEPQESIYVDKVDVGNDERINPTVEDPNCIPKFLNPLATQTVVEDKNTNKQEEKKVELSLAAKRRAKLMSMDVDVSPKSMSSYCQTVVEDKNTNKQEEKKVELSLAAKRRAKLMSMDVDVSPKSMSSYARVQSSTQDLDNAFYASNNVHSTASCNYSTLQYLSNVANFRATANHNAPQSFYNIASLAPVNHNAFPSFPKIAPCSSPLNPNGLQSFPNIAPSPAPVNHNTPQDISKIALSALLLHNAFPSFPNIAPCSSPLDSNGLQSFPNIAPSPAPVNHTHGCYCGAKLPSRFENNLPVMQSGIQNQAIVDQLRMMQLNGLDTQSQQPAQNYQFLPRLPNGYPGAWQDVAGALPPYFSSN